MSKFNNVFTGRAKREAGEQAAAKAPKKARAPFHLDPEILEKARDVAYWVPGLTLSDLAANALRAEIARLEKVRGEPFPPRTEELKAGRPIGGGGR